MFYNEQIPFEITFIIVMFENYLLIILDLEMKEIIF